MFYLDNAARSPYTTAMRYKLNNAERHYILNRYAVDIADGRDVCGFEREMLDRLRASKCQTCRGSGFASYVGGYSDENLCVNCSGSGFDPYGA